MKEPPQHTMSAHPAGGLTVHQTVRVSRQVVYAPSSQDAKSALHRLAATGRGRHNSHRGLIALSGLLLLLPSLQPEILTAMAMALRTSGRLREAKVIAQQRVRLGTLHARATTLPSLVAVCLRLDVREVTAALRVVLTLLPSPRRPVVTLPSEGAFPHLGILPAPDASLLGADRRYVQHHVPGLLEVWTDLAAKRKREEQDRHLTETTVLPFVPGTLREPQREIPVRMLSAHQLALKLAYSTPTQQQALLGPVLRQRGPAQVLLLTEQLLLCQPSNETLATTLRGHLVALRANGGLLALAATMLRSEATFFAHLALFTNLGEISPAEDPLALRWLWSRLWERHPLSRDIPLAVALLGRSSDADVCLGIALAAHLTPQVAWAKAALETAAAPALLVAAVEQRVPGLVALLRTSVEALVAETRCSLAVVAR